MKESHRDIGWMVAPPPTPEARQHEGLLEREIEPMEVVDEAKEERLEIREDKKENIGMEIKQVMQGGGVGDGVGEVLGDIGGQEYCELCKGW